MRSLCAKSARPTSALVRGERLLMMRSMVPCGCLRGTLRPVGNIPLVCGSMIEAPGEPKHHHTIYSRPNHVCEVDHWNSPTAVQTHPYITVMHHFGLPREMRRLRNSEQLWSNGTAAGSGRNYALWIVMLSSVRLCIDSSAVLIWQNFAKRMPNLILANIS